MPTEVKNAVGIIATGFVLATLVLQGLSLRPLIHKLGLDRLSTIEQALSAQVLAVALQEVRETVAGEIRDRAIDHDIVRSEAKRLGDITQEAVAQAEAADEVLDRERVTLGLIALAAREFDLVIEALDEGRISTSLYEGMIVDAGRLMENSRTKGRSGYRAAARRSIDFGWRLRVAVFLHRRFRMSRMLSKVTSLRFEVLVAQRGTIEDLHRYVDGRIRRIHGKRVSDILHEILSKREEAIISLMEGLRLQYPGYSENMLRRWIRRMALRVERKEYETLLADNLIDPELFKNLMTRINTEVKELDRPIKIDLTTQKDVLLRGLEIFKDLDDDAIGALSRALHVRYVEPGEILLRKEDMPRSVWLIASGAIQVTRKTGSYMLGQGDFFGHFSLLTRALRHAEMKAISYGTLFELEEKRFKKLVRGNSVLMENILRQAGKLGIDIDKRHFE